MKILVLVTHYRGCGGKKCQFSKNHEWIKDTLGSKGLLVDSLNYWVYKGWRHEDVYEAEVEGVWKSPLDKWIFKRAEHFVELRRF